MKALLLMLSLSFLSFKTSDVRIYYVLNADGKEVAKRIENKVSYWQISDPATALESMYQEKIKAETKYELAKSILKTLDVNGVAEDKQKYNVAVSQYNSYIKTTQK